MKRIFLVLCLLLALSVTPVEAATYSYSTHFLEVDVPDSTLVMTQSTSKYDDVWTAAGVTNSSEKIDEFKQMGVVASFYDPSSKETVNFIYNKSAETIDIFTLEGRSDAEIVNLLTDLMSESMMDDMVMDITVPGKLDGVPYFRMVLDATATDSPCTEIIYGALVNGEMLQFDAFKEGKGEVSEAFLSVVTSGVKFTRIMTRDEYETETRTGVMRFIRTSAIIVAIAAVLIALSTLNNKKKEKHAKEISNAMTKFREDKRAGRIAETEPKFTAETLYTNDLMAVYGMFRAWLMNLGGLLIGLAIALSLVIFMIKTDFFIYAIVTIIFTIVILFSHYTRCEKIRDALARRYNVKANPTASFAFYDDYFTVSGIGSVNEYIYDQITKIKIHKGYVFIFTGSDHALLVDKSRISGGSASELVKFIKR